MPVHYKCSGQVQHLLHTEGLPPGCNGHMHVYPEVGLQFACDQLCHVPHRQSDSMCVQPPLSPQKVRSPKSPTSPKKNLSSALRNQVRLPAGSLSLPVSCVQSAGHVPRISASAAPVIKTKRRWTIHRSIEQ